jgi:branched-subunit amino acid aminotransferase/4-amino-4-deoxychorismate lyase
VIPPDDRGFTLGDGVFETVRAEGGRLWMWDAHMARLAASADTLGLPAPDVSEARAAAERALTDVGAARAAVRISWSAGSGGRGLDRPATLSPRLTVTAAPAPRPDTPARLAWATLRRNERSPLSRCKSLSYLDNVLARAEARRAGADEALLLDTQGRVSGAAAANLFWICGDRLFTPAVAYGVLAGVMRAQVLAAARRLGVEAVEAEASPHEVEEADALFLTNVLVGLRPAGLAPPPAPHPLITRLELEAERISRSDS